MRTFTFAVLLLVSGAADAQSQRSFFEAGIGRGARGLSVRIAAGLGGHVVTPVVRFTGGEGEFDSELIPGRRYRQGNYEIGLSLARTADLTNRVSVGGGAGLALALASRDVVGEPASSFGIGGFDAGLTVPIEATVLVGITPAVSVSVVGYRSLSLGTASTPENTPETRERFNPDIGHWGAMAGLRFGL